MCCWRVDIQTMIEPPPRLGSTSRKWSELLADSPNAFAWIVLLGGSSALSLEIAKGWEGTRGDEDPLFRLRAFLA